jgi:hypothetical protein
MQHKEEIRRNYLNKKAFLPQGELFMIHFTGDEKPTERRGGILIPANKKVVEEETTVYRISAHDKTMTCGLNKKFYNELDTISCLQNLLQNEEVVMIQVFIRRTDNEQGRTNSY